MNPLTFTLEENCNERLYFFGGLSHGNKRRSEAYAGKSPLFELRIDWDQGSGKPKGGQVLKSKLLGD